MSRSGAGAAWVGTGQAVVLDMASPAPALPLLVRTQEEWAPLAIVARDALGNVVRFPADATVALDIVAINGSDVAAPVLTGNVVFNPAAADISRTEVVLTDVKVSASPGATLQLRVSVPVAGHAIAPLHLPVFVQRCDPGQRPVLASCEPCGPGEHSPSGLQCLPCPPGSFATLPGAHSCTPCPVGTYVSTERTASVQACLDCPSGATTLAVGASALSACVCLPLSYALAASHNASSADPVVCTACPSETTKCPQHGTTIATLQVLPGLWRTSSASDTFYDCPWPDMCAGTPLLVANDTGNAMGASASGAVSRMTATVVDDVPPAAAVVLDTSPAGLCAPGSYGPLCGTCMTGWHRAGGACRRCTAAQLDKVRLLAVGAAIVVVAVLVLVAIRWWLRRQQALEFEAALEEVAAQSSASSSPSPVSSFASPTPPSPASLASRGARVRGMRRPAAAAAATAAPPGHSGTTPGVDIKRSLSRQQLVAATRQSYTRTALRASRKAKVLGSARNKVMIVISYMQVVAMFPTSFGIQYPASVERLFSWFAAANVDLVSAMSVSCAFPSANSHATRLLLSTLAPVAVALLLLAVQRWSAFVARRREARGQPPSVFVWLQDKCYDAMLLFLFLIYPSTASTVFLTFACHRFHDGTAFMVTQLTAPCSGASYLSLVVYAATSAVILVAGIPLCYLVLLTRNRQHLAAGLSDTPPPEAAVARRISFLYADYRPGCWWFEIFELYRKVLLTGVSVLVLRRTVSQLALGLVVAQASLLTYSLTKPYLDRATNMFAVAAQTSLFMTLLGGILVKARASAVDAHDAGTLAVLMVALNVAVPAIAVAMLFVKHVVRPWRQSGKHHSGFRPRLRMVLGLPHPKGKDKQRRSSASKDYDEQRRPSPSKGNNKQRRGPSRRKSREGGDSVELVIVNPMQGVT